MPDIKTVKDFLNSEQADYASYSTLRAIGSLIDGLKNSSRKIVYTSQAKLNSDTKVETFANFAASYCLDYNTMIQLANGSEISIGEWTTKYPEEVYEVLCVNDQGESCVSLGHSPRETKQTQELIEITIDGEVIRCTPDHLIFVKRGELCWVKAKDLYHGDEIISNNFFK